MKPKKPDLTELARHMARAEQLKAEARTSGGFVNVRANGKQCRVPVALRPSNRVMPGTSLEQLRLRLAVDDAEFDRLMGK